MFENENIPEDVAEVFGWDKLGDVEEVSKPAEGEDGKEEEVVSVPEGAATPEPEASSSVPTSQPEGDKSDEEIGKPDEVALLKEKLKVLQGKLETKEPEKPKEEEKTPEAEPVPSYAFQIPDKMVEAFASEDPEERRAAIGALVQGVSQSIHKTLRVEFQQKLQAEVGQVLPQVMNVLQYQNQAKTINSDFYGKYPVLNTPEFHDIVSQTSREYMQANNVSKWSAEVRDKIAELVFQRLGMKKAPVAKPQKFTPQTTRPAAQGKNNSEQDDIFNTLF